MSTESTVEDIHRAVEAAISADMSIKEFIQNVALSWDQVLEDKQQSADDSFKKLLATNGVY